MSVQQATAVPKSSDASGRSVSVSSASRSPSAYEPAIAAASSRHDEANPESDGIRSSDLHADRRPPMPIPESATARIKPKVKTEPPSSGPSMRYHTSSIRKNVKPTTAEAMSRKSSEPGVPRT